MYGSTYRRALPEVLTVGNTNNSASLKLAEAETQHPLINASIAAAEK
jgi:hypothetical protein